MRRVLHSAVLAGALLAPHAACSIRGRAKADASTTSPTTSPTTSAAAAPHASLDEPTFRVEYPPPWRIERREHSVTLEDPVTLCWVMFLPGATGFEGQVNAQLDSSYKGAAPAQRPFTSWGSLPGRGVEIRGLKHGRYPGFTRVFAASSGREIIVIESCVEEHEHEVAPELDAIAKSFTFK